MARIIYQRQKRSGSRSASVKKRIFYEDIQYFFGKKRNVSAFGKRAFQYVCVRHYAV